MYNNTSVLCSSEGHEERISSAIKTSEQEKLANKKTEKCVNKHKIDKSCSREQLLSNMHKLESDNPILSSCLEYNAQTLQANRGDNTKLSELASTPALSIADDKYISHDNMHRLEKLQNLLLRASARHVSTSEREHAIREILNILSANSHGSMKEAINSVSLYLQEVNSKVKTTEKSKKEAVQLQEQAVYAKCEKFFESKIRSLLREQQISLNKIAQLENVIMTMREERDNDLDRAKHDIMERLEEYERREHDMTYYRRLIATVYKTNEKITHYNEELEALLRHHRINLPPVPEPDLFAFTAKANTHVTNYHSNQITNVENTSAISVSNSAEKNFNEVDKEITNASLDYKFNSDDASMPVPSLPQTTRALREQVTDNFIAASKVEMNEARLSLEQQLLHCAFDERSAYKLQVTGLKHENANLKFEVHRLQEEVSTLSKYIHEKKYKGATYYNNKDHNEENTINGHTTVPRTDNKFTNNHNEENRQLEEEEKEENNTVFQSVHEKEEMENYVEHCDDEHNTIKKSDDDDHHALLRHSHVNNAVKHKLQKLPSSSDENSAIDTVNDTHKQKIINDATEAADKLCYRANNSVEDRNVKCLPCANENAMIRYDGPLTPRPCNIPFAIHNELGISLQSSTSDMVSELATVSINLKHQLNSSLLRLRQLTTFSEWVNEESLREIDEIENEVNVIPTIGSALWEHSPHFLRTRVEPDVNNLGWTATQTSWLLYQFFVHYSILRHECVNYEDDKMIAPRVHQLSEHRELLIPPLNRLDATREQMTADEECVPVGYVVSWFITKFLSNMTADEVKNSPYTAPGTSQVWLCNKNNINISSSNVNNNSAATMHRRVMEIEFANFAYNLWYCAQKFSKTQPLCQLFVDVVTGTLPISVFAIMEQVATVIELEIRELDVDRSGYFTYHKLANMLIRMLNDWDAHSLYSGTLAIAETFAENKISLSNGFIHKNLLLASERLMYAEHSTETICENEKEKCITSGQQENLVLETTSDEDNSGYETKNNIVTSDSVAIPSKQNDHFKSITIQSTQSSKSHNEVKFVYGVHKICNSSIFIRYWRRLVIERVRIIFVFTEQLLAPLIEESEVIFGMYMLPVNRARAKLHELDHDNELKAESFVNDTFLSFQRSHTNTHAMKSVFNKDENRSRQNKNNSYYGEEKKKDESSFDETEESEIVKNVYDEDAGIPRLSIEYLSLLQSRKNILQARQTTTKMMLEKIFEFAVKSLTRFDERVHFPFRAIRNDTMNNTDFHMNTNTSNHIKELEGEQHKLDVVKVNESQSKTKPMKLTTDNINNGKEENSNAKEINKMSVEFRNTKRKVNTSRKKIIDKLTSHAKRIIEIEEFEINVNGKDSQASGETMIRENNKLQEVNTSMTLQNDDKRSDVKHKVKLPKLKQNITPQTTLKESTSNTISTKNKIDAVAKNAFKHDDNGVLSKIAVSHTNKSEDVKNKEQTNKCGSDKECTSRQHDEE